MISLLLFLTFSLHAVSTDYTPFFGPATAANSPPVGIASDQFSLMSTAANQSSEITALQQIQVNTATNTTSFATSSVLAVPSDGAKATYSATSTNLVIATTTPTDGWCISGSATKLVRVLRIGISGSQTTAGQRDVILLKHSTADSGGISTAVPMVPHDSNSAAATSVILAYTANPTVGTVVGTIRSAKLYFSTAAGDSDNWFWDFGTRPAQGLILRGTAQQICVGFNGIAAVGNQVNINAEITEE